MKKLEYIESIKARISELEKELIVANALPETYEKVTYEISFMHGDADIYTDSVYVTDRSSEIKLLDYVMSTRCEKEHSYYSILNYDIEIVKNFIKEDEDLSLIINTRFINKDIEMFEEDFKDYLYKIKFLEYDNWFHDSGEPCSVECIKRI